MPKFSRISKKRLETCDIRLQNIFNEVVKTYDCSILCGYRTKQEQNNAFNKGRSKLKYPHSKHNKYPSKAVDVAPYYKKRGIN
jgi:peptidoglycan L-alanyl-D-glutamate endopeptidase CwlK